MSQGPAEARPTVAAMVARMVAGMVRWMCELRIVNQRVRRGSPVGQGDWVRNGVSGQNTSYFSNILSHSHITA